MTKGTFLHAMKDRGLNIENYTLWDKPTVLKNWDTGEEVSFESVEDAYEHAMIGDRPLKESVDEAETVDDLFSVTLDDNDIRIISREEERLLF